jgi:gamma-glutamyl-gamma-aminobutyrate hydrolase PuuD
MEERTPIIGIFGWKTGDNSYGSAVSYMQYANHFGIVRVLTPDEPIDPRIDLIIIPGGADINPVRYGEIPNLWTSKADPVKEYFDTVILPQYIKLGIPVFGINESSPTR